MMRFYKIVSAFLIGMCVNLLLVIGVGWAQSDMESSAPIQAVDVGEGYSTINEEADLDAIDPGDPPIMRPPADPTYDSNLRISGAVLRPRASNVEWDWGGGGGCLYESSGSTSVVFTAPVFLPQGAVVGKLRMYFNDTHASKDSAGWFIAYNASGSVHDEWIVSSDGDDGPGFSDSAEINHTIDYGSYSYVVGWRPQELGGDMQLCGFRIFYNAAPVKAPKVEIGPLQTGP